MFKNLLILLLSAGLVVCVLCSCITVEVQPVTPNEETEVSDIIEDGDVEEREKVKVDTGLVEELKKKLEESKKAESISEEETVVEEKADTENVNEDALVDNEEEIIEEEPAVIEDVETDIVSQESTENVEDEIVVEDVNTQETVAEEIVEPTDVKTDVEIVE